MMSLKAFREHWGRRTREELLGTGGSFLLVAAGARGLPSGQGPTLDDDAPVDLFTKRTNLEDTTRILQGGRGTASLEFDQTLVCPIEKRPGANEFTMFVTIGRAPNNDIVLASQDVSKFHGYLTRSGGAWQLYDGKSRNGTFVDEARLEPGKPHALELNALIRFGGLPARFVDAATLAHAVFPPGA